MIDRITSGFNPIDAPANLQVTDTTDNSASLSWKQVSGASGYNVYRNGEKVNNGIVTVITFTANNLNSGSTYTFTVKAVSSAGSESAPSNSVTAKTTGEPPAVEVPSGLTVTDVTSNSVTLKWQSAAGAEKYNIYRNGNKIADVSSTSYTDTSLNAGTDYNYQVSSVKGSQETEKSSELKVTTLTQKVCYEDSNFNHVAAGRATQVLGYVYANGSNQNMGLYNIFVRRNICKTKENYYVIE
jgi:fibronectin type 3 domain-containing protein